MSHSSSRRKVLDIEGLLVHRASHARSCANHVANRLGITRSELLMKVEKETGASLISPLTEDELMKAFNFGELSYVQQLELFKRSYLEKKNYAKPFYEKTAAKKRLQGEDRRFANEHSGHAEKAQAIFIAMSGEFGTYL